MTDFRLDEDFFAAIGDAASAESASAAVDDDDEPFLDDDCLAALFSAR
jgi:hypothetical protein